VIVAQEQDGHMVEDFLNRIGELIAEMGPMEWGIAVVVVGLLMFGIIKQVAKVAVLGVGLAVVGIVVLNAQSQNWGFSF
jgi:hypothetical protein